MPSHWFKAAAAGLLVSMSFAPVVAQEPGGVDVTIGLGAAAVPDYFGASGMRIAPTGAFTIQRLVLPGGFGIGSESALPTDPGFGPRGAFRFVPARKDSDNSELEGLDDIDYAVELGLGLFQITERTRLYGEVRRGFGGYNGWVAEAGVDAILRPTDRLVLTAGPRAAWGDEDFVGTYFGVTPAEAAESRYAAYGPSGGLVSLGIELNARYDYQNGWGLHGTLGWLRLQGDAAESPITRAGSEDQFGARLILTRTFSVGW
jgi:outer membrane protein